MKKQAIKQIINKPGNLPMFTDNFSIVNIGLLRCSYKLFEHDKRKDKEFYLNSIYCNEPKNENIIHLVINGKTGEIQEAEKVWIEKIEFQPSIKYAEI